jgi:nitrate/nitrite transport system permease protein
MNQPVAVMDTSSTVALPSPKPAVERTPAQKLMSSGIAVWIKLNIVPAILGFAFFFGVWTLISAYAPDLPKPYDTFEKCYEFLRANMTSNQNRVGVPMLVLYSLVRVLVGFAIGAIVAIPLGFWIGSSPFIRSALTPLMEICRPISPLAWYPVALVMFSAPMLENESFKAPTMAAIFVIFICSLWPTVVNTAFGVTQINKDFLNVARMLKMNKWQVLRYVLWPSVLPNIVTGLRISLGIAWMVIVAAEMLNGQDGIGFFCWDQYNAGSVALSILAMAMIGSVGLIMNIVMLRLEKMVTYDRQS